MGHTSLCACALVLFLAALALAADPPASQPTSRPERRPGSMLFHSGTILNEALFGLDLDAATRERVNAALKPVVARQQVEDQEAIDKRKAINERANAETDPQKKKQLLAEWKAVKGPTDVERYGNVKAAVEGVLTKEQFARLDGFTREVMADQAEQEFRHWFGLWAKSGVELSAEQKAKVDAVAVAVRDEAGQLPPGAVHDAQKVGNTAASHARSGILSEEQRAKLKTAP